MNSEPAWQTILVVDDTAENITILSSLLRGLYRTRIATNGLQALEISASVTDRPDLILLDIRMPDMDGYEVCRRLKENESLRDIPVIFLSSLHEVVDKVKAFSVGGIDYVTKPFNSEELRARVAIQLKVRRLQLELKKQNDTLQRFNEQLRQLQTLKDEFIGIASHDLRGLLAGVLGYTSLMELDAVPGSTVTDEMQGWVGIIASQCEVMQRIIADFLEFQAMEDGQFKLSLETVDINEMAREVTKRNGAYAASKSIRINLDLAPCEINSEIDVNLINQVLQNFVGNAIKFCPQGEQVTVCTRHDAGLVTVEIKDSGLGLSEEDLTKLFVKYARLSNKPTGGEKSSGLGLAICRKMIELHGGVTGARNNDTGGATFWFNLPSIQATPLPSQEPS